MIIYPAKTFAGLSATLTASPQYLQADGVSTSTITITIVDAETGSPKAGVTVYFGKYTPNETDYFASSVTNSYGQAKTTFTSGTVPEKAWISVVYYDSTLNSWVGKWVAVYVVEVKVEGPKFIGINNTVVFTAKITPQISGQYHWWITQGSDKARINSSNIYQTLSVKGTGVSQNLDDVTIRLYFKPQNLGYWFKPVYHSLTVAKAEVKSVKFTSDHGVLRNNVSDWGDGGATYTQPEWVKYYSINNPITQTKNTTLTVDAVVKVQPAGITFDIVGDGPNNYVDFSKGSYISTGYDQALSGASAYSPLPNYVTTLYDSINWMIRCYSTSSSDIIPSDISGPHTICVTYGSPYGSVITHLRMNWATAVANLQSTPQGIADAMYNNFSIPPPYFQLQDPNIPNPLWLLMSGSEYQGQCIHLAKLMKLAIELLGGSASTGFVYGSSDTNCYSTSSRAWEARRCYRHGTERIYIYSAGGWNNWEGVCVAGGKYYGIQLYSGTYPVEILRYWLGSNQTSGNYQAWRYWTGTQWASCKYPGPYPVPKP